MYLLDTDHCVFLLRQDPTVLEQFERRTAEEAYVSLVTAGELLFGAYRSSRVDENIRQVNDLLDASVILPLSRTTMDRFAQIKAELFRKGQKLSDPDLLIAATAIENGLVLVTHNTSHYERIDGLRLQDWHA